MSDLVIPLDTSQAQARASDPRASAWVSANAGSGKTTVLSYRVIRLLLDGADPGRILSITFTKAAAANMASRVFDILGRWVGLSNEALAKDVEKVDGRRPDQARLERARRLFACAVETPGGLKIQTIHAFCERLLHLFPFEANVAARFEVLDDMARAELLAQAQAVVLARAQASVDPALADALARVNEIAAEADFEALIAAALPLAGVLRDKAGGEDGLAVLRARIAAALGHDAGLTRARAVADLLDGGYPRTEWPAAIAELAAGSATEQKLAEHWRRAMGATDPDLALDSYLCVFLTNDRAPRSDRAFLSKAFCARNPVLAEALRGERARVHAGLDVLRAAEAIDRTLALLRIVQGIALRYQEAKVQRGALDFEDLIGRTAALLSRSDAAFVLYKLDQGIDHILVDEAQDTSAEQWAILRAIAEDFVAGEGRTTRPRTIFAVGDPKQSIFSFQGAAPAIFEETRRHFATRIAALQDSAGPGRWRFHDEKLQLSFRSAPDVLQAVDWVFGLDAHYRSLSFEDPVAPSHTSARCSAAGLVEVWETEKPVLVAEPDAWTKPLDEPEAGAPAVRLARRIAALVALWQERGDETGRIIRPGEILILVRSRNAFFEAIIRALKDRGVPVAGADRLALTRHIAVLDLVALGRASLLPEDDLTLATVLKSPLVGLCEDDLLALAWDRPGSLAAALEAAATADPRLAVVQETLARWREQARRCGPFSFYAGVLGPEGGRRAMLSRLGAEARDAVDEFLRLALEHEQRQAPSLPLFLSSLEGADITIKRDMDTIADEVRVMTVHGAKGLEANVVFLADTCSAPDGKNDSPILALRGPDGAAVPVWSPGGAHDCAVLAQARQAMRAEQRDEYHRLLYVAMTRARDRLYIAGFEGARGRARDCWYDMIRATLDPHLAEVPGEGGEPSVWRYQTRPFPPAAAPKTSAAGTGRSLPGWLSEPVAPEPAARPPLRPSSAAEAADAPPRGLDAPYVREARAAGVLVHALLESLPGCDPRHREAAATALVEARGGAVSPERRQRIVADVLALLAEPRLAPLFGPRSRGEVPVAGTLPLGPGGAAIPVSGQIDRLAVTEDAVYVADYKTRADPPESAADVPLSHVAQLAVYRALVARLFPDRPVRCMLVWTSGPTVTEIAADALDAALARIKAA